MGLSYSQDAGNNRSSPNKASSGELQGQFSLPAARTINSSMWRCLLEGKHAQQKKVILTPELTLRQVSQSVVRSVTIHGLVY